MSFGGNESPEAMLSTIASYLAGIVMTVKSAGKSLDGLTELAGGVGFGTVTAIATYTLEIYGALALF